MRPFEITVFFFVFLFFRFSCPMLIALEMSTPCLNAPMMAGVKSVTALTRTTPGSDVLRKVSELLVRMSVPVI